MARSRGPSNYDEEAIQSTVSTIGMPPIDPNSPCPQPRKKRKRSSIDQETSPSTQSSREKPCFATSRHASSNDESCSFTHPVASETELLSHATNARIDVIPEAKKWQSLIIGICDCTSNHALHSTILPRSAVMTWDELKKHTQKLCKVAPSQGVYTDLEGNDIYEFESLYPDYYDDGLPGVIWHRDFYAGVSLGNRNAAQVQIKSCLAAQLRAILTHEFSAPRLRQSRSRELDTESKPEQEPEFLLPSSRQQTFVVTPARRPRKAVSPATSSPVPFTIRTSPTSGRISHLKSHDLRSSIHSERMPNVFHERESSPAECPYCSGELGDCACEVDALEKIYALGTGPNFV